MQLQRAVTPPLIALILLVWFGGGLTGAGPVAAAPGVCRANAPAAAPGPLTAQPLEALSSRAAAYVKNSPNIGVAVVVPGRGAMFVANADTQYDLLSTAKVPIMLTLLSQLSASGAAPTASDLSLLTRMITKSDNNAATALWEQVGGATAVSAYLESIGVSATLNAANWGAGVISPVESAKLMSHLLEGDLLRGTNQRLALRLLESVDPSQAWGLPNDSPSRAFTGVKNGWYLETDGWELNSVGFVIPRTGPSYTVAIYSKSWSTQGKGIGTIEAIAAAIHRDLSGAVGSGGTRLALADCG